MKFPRRLRLVFLTFVVLIVVAVLCAGFWYWNLSHRFVEESQHSLDGIDRKPIAEHIVFNNVSVWDGASDALVRDAAVEVRDGAIVAVRGAGVPVPSGARVIDGRGLTLMPGIIDAHVHLMHDSGPDLLTRGHHAMSAWVETVSHYPESRDDIVRRTQLKLKAGVTTMRVLGDGYYALELRNDIARWDVVAPRIIAAGLHVNGPDGYVTGGIASSLDERRRSMTALELRTFGEIETKIDSHIAHGIDVVKIATTHGDLGFTDARPDLPVEWVREIVRVAHARGLKVTSHSYGDAGDWAAINGGVDGIEHLVNVPHPLSDEMVRAIRDRHIVVCPTLSGSSYSVVRFLRSPELLESDPLLRANVAADVRKSLYLTLRVLRLPGVARFVTHEDDPMQKWETWYRFSLLNTKKLYDGGVQLVFGTDTPFAFGNFHHSIMGEVRALHEAGIPNVEILRMATSRGARTIGLDKEIGTIEPGKRADLILVAGDPVADVEALGNVVLVMKEGRVVFRAPPSK